MPSCVSRCSSRDMLLSTYLLSNWLILDTPVLLQCLLGLLSFLFAVCIFTSYLSSSLQWFSCGICATTSTLYTTEERTKISRSPPVWLQNHTSCTRNLFPNDGINIGCNEFRMAASRTKSKFQCQSHGCYHPGFFLSPVE